MLLTVATIGLFLQIPQNTELKTWVDQGFDSATPHAFAISGSPELSRQEARASALRSALEDQQNQLRDLAATHASDASPAWLPGFLRDRAVHRWTRDQLDRSQPKILDEEILVREHEFGLSYQAFLLVDQLDPGTPRSRGSLVRRLQNEEEEFLVKCGSVVGLWGLLALSLFWVDRLTRGYMTKRLFALGTALGLAAPTLAVLV